MPDSSRAEAAETPPRYRQVRDHVQRRIAAGDWPPGARVPSENELTRALGVSRMTVNRALRELTAEGLLRREQGVGTFVAAPKPQSELLQIRNIREEVEERGHSYGCRVLVLERARATAETARALELEAGAEIFRSRLLHLESGAPAALEERAVTPAFAPGYAEQDFTRITPYEYLTELGPLDAVEHEIEAVRPGAEARRLLELRPEDPCLLLTRRTWSRGLVVSRAHFLYPGPRYRLAGRQDFTAPASHGGTP